MYLLAGFSAFGIFLGIAAIGFLILMVTFVVGELFELGDIMGDHDVDVHGGGGPSFLSGRVLSVFITAFGGFGAIGIHLGYGIGVSTAIGLASGLVFGGLVFLFVSFLHSQQASSDLRVQELVGCLAQVSVAIPKGGLGQIRCTLGESGIEKIACSVDGAEIPANTLVKVEAIVGETVVVRRAE
jgi:membrane protein implicated in regulation of membrane protease activity